ncbi:MAG TPA: hypothetical protein VGU45_03300 [Microvirga sp.]|jgi:hypothetical protein|nr:hypothetical protein [Microvirga sp.]
MDSKQEPTMIVTADEVHRSVRGAIELLNRRVEGLKAFDMSETGFWRSFAAIWLTLPAYVVSLAFERLRIGLPPDGNLLDHVGLDLAVAFAHVASFVALPVAMIWIVRRIGLTSRYVPFVIVTNWITVLSLIVLSLPGFLLVTGMATAQLAGFFTLAFAIVIVRLQWFATIVTLGVSGGLAAGIVGLGIGLNFGIGTLLHAAIG